MQIGSTISGGLIGAPVAGGLFVVAASLPFAVDAVTFALAALLAFTLPRTPAAEAVPAPRAGLWGAAVDGVRWMWREPALRLLALLSAAANLVIGALVAVMVLLILDVFKVPEAAYGLLTLVGAVGGIAGGLFASRIGARFGILPALRWVLVMQAVALTALAVSGQVVVGGAALGIFIAGTATWNVLANTYQQQAVPAELRGRTGAASRVVALTSAPVGAALGGFIAGQYGVPSVAVFGAVVFAVLAVAAWRSLGGASAPAG
jgi:predicted MFS family arabinose efflux permease